MGLRWTEEEYEDFINKRKNSTSNTCKTITKKTKRSKYKSNIVKIDGIKFRSKKEGDKYLDLKLRIKSGDIKGFCMQPKFILVEGNESDNGITYSADFIIFNNDNTYEIVDTKGYETQQWKRTYKMFRLKYPGLDLNIEK